jgi:chromosome segregation ATPase
MKNNRCFSGLGLFMLFIAIPCVTFAQVDKKAAELKKLETGVNTAKNNVAKNEKLLAKADSLIAIGTTQVNDSKVEIKTIETERKKLDKDYGTSKKSLAKLATSKDKAEVTQAKADFKTLDIKYKADVKALDLRLRESTKKSTTGSANLDKGKMNKKTAEDGLKTSQAALEVAQAKYDAASGTGEGNGDDKKKNK